MKQALTWLLSGLVILFGAVQQPAQAQTEVKELRVAVQPGILFLPMWVMREGRLFEEHAKKMGLGEVKTTWSNLTSGGANADLLLSGNTDIVGGGVSNVLILWSRTKGEVKAIAAVSGVPSVLVTRDPNVKSLRDFSEKNRIAVPTIKMSLQAIWLQMALEKEFGEGGFKKFDSMMVQMGHPQAALSVLTANSPVDTHFASAPYYQTLLKEKTTRAIMTSMDVVGPATSLLAYTSNKFYSANPKTVQAFVAALDEAHKMARENPKKAAELYLAATKDKYTVDEIVEMLKEPGMVFTTVPHAAMQFAEHMHKVGTLNEKPSSWKDFFFPMIHDRNGN